jgi:formamidopyrimidine-DNA glycosylase
MPELPDVALYVDALRERVGGSRLLRLSIASPFLLRSVDPPPDAAVGRKVVDVRRLGKRVVLAVEGELFLVLHLMIAGRLHWDRKGGTPLASFAFERGTLTLTEAGSRKRASLHVVAGEAALRAHDPGGVEPLDATSTAFAEALRRENHTLKRALTDPRLFSGIGNAWSDEILHRARLSPLAMTAKLEENEVERLRAAVVDVLTSATERLRRESGASFPEGVTAFRPWMAVHGRFGKPCPACGAPVQRIVYAENETNYCAGCQTGGKILADRALSRLLKGDWPRTLEELEEGRGGFPG